MNERAHHRSLAYGNDIVHASGAELDWARAEAGPASRTGSERRAHCNHRSPRRPHLAAGMSANAPVCRASGRRIALARTGISDH